MKRKFLSLVLASAMSVTMLAGCGTRQMMVEQETAVRKKER